MPKNIFFMSMILLCLFTRFGHGYFFLPVSYGNEVVMPESDPDPEAESKASGAIGWQYGTPIPQGAGKPDGWTHCGSGVSGGLLWLFGGKTDSDWKDLDRVGSYDPFQGIWKLDYPPLKTGRAYLAGAAGEGTLFAIGGTDQANSYFEDAFESAVTGVNMAWISLPPLPDRRSDGAAVFHKNHLYYIGGTKSIEFDEKGDVVAVREETNLWLYSMASGIWVITLQKSPVGLTFVSAAIVKGKIYVPGSSSSSDTFVYDIASNSWSRIAAPHEMPISIYYQCVPVGRQIWRIGGLTINESGGAPTNDVWVLDTEKGQWSKHPSAMNVPRMSFAAGIVGRRVVVAGGIKEISAADGEVFFIPTNTTEFLELPDTDSDGIPDLVEEAGCTDPFDADTDDDGIPDGVEDADRDGLLDSVETDPCNPDTDGDGIQDGTESGYTLAMATPDTDKGLFQPDLDASNRTNPLNPDTDGDGIPDGQEDLNKNGRVDPGEFNPNVWSVFFVAEGGACGGMTPCFGKIQDAINSSTTHVLIKIKDGYFAENITLQQDKQSTLSGGYRAGFTDSSGWTLLPSLISAGGLVIFERIIIGPIPK